MSSVKKNPRGNADDAFEAFMSMPDEEWRGLVMSLVSGGVLEFEENKGFERAMKERSKPKALTAPGRAKSLMLSVTAETIGAVRDKYLALTVNGIDDKDGLERVHEARMACVKARTTCEREHKAIKEDALRECQLIDKSRRDLLALIAPIEQHLEDQEESVARERARLVKIEDDKRYAARLARIIAAGADEDGSAFREQQIRAMTDSEFELAVIRTQEETDRRNAEAVRLAEEREANRIEAAKLAEEREALDKIRREQQAEADRLAKIESDRLAAERAEQARLAEAERLRIRREEMAKAAAEAAERARIETESRLKREAEEIEAKRQAAEVERLREEAMRPDRDKLLAVANAIAEIDLPEVSEESASILKTVEQIIVVAVRQIRVAATSKPKTL